MTSFPANKPLLLLLSKTAKDIRSQGHKARLKKHRLWDKRLSRTAIADCIKNMLLESK